MKKTWAFLGLLLISVAAYAALDWEIPNNVMKMGDGTNATAKSFEMRMGLGASNPILSSLDGTEMNVNIPFRVQGNLTATGDGNFNGSVTMGDGTSNDRTLLVDRGGSNPFLRWDESAGAWIFSNDGTLEKKIGSGSGGGAGGINLLLNPSFEDPGSPILNWNFTGGTLTQEDHVNGREGNLKFARFVATAGSQFMESDTVTISDDIGPGCMADMKYTQGDNAFEYKVLKSPFADPADVVSTGTFSDLTEFTKAPTIVFPCEGGDQFRLRITSTAAGTIDLDEAYMGSNKGFVDGQTSAKAIAYTPTFQGFGTPTEVDFTYTIVGRDFIIIDGEFRAGTTTAVEARVGLPVGMLPSYLEAKKVVGRMEYKSTTNVNDYVALADDGQNYLRFGIIGAAGFNPDTPQNGSTLIGSNFKASVRAIVKIPGVGSNSTQEAFTPEQSEFEAIAVLDSPNFFIGTTFAEQTISNGSMTLNNIKGSCQIACAGTEESSGTTCSVGNESLGVSCNLPNAGRYEVCADMNMTVSSGSGGGGGNMNLAARIVETENASQSIIQSFDEYTSWAFSNSAVAGTHTTESKQRFCQVFDVNSVGKKTFRVTMNGSGGGATNGATYIGSSGGKNTGLKFTIKQVAHDVSRPIVNNMVSTQYRDGKNTEDCKIVISGSPTVNDESGLCGWIDNVAPVATGRATINFTTGSFANVVECTGNNATGGSKIVSFNNHTANSVEVLNYSDAGGLENATVTVSCKGAKR